jgi:hypothetical protein
VSEALKKRKEPLRLTSRALFGVACQETMKTRAESHASYKRLRIAKLSDWQSRSASLAAFGWARNRHPKRVWEAWLRDMRRAWMNERSASEPQGERIQEQPSKEDDGKRPAHEH